MTYTAGEAAKQLEMSAHTLRYYEHGGPLPFIERNENRILILKEFT